MKRDDRSNYHAFGGEIDFLFENLYGWVVDVTRDDGSTEVLVVIDGYDPDGYLVGYEYDKGEETGLIFDRDIDGVVPDGPLDGVPVTSDVAVRIPWADIDVVEVN